MNTYVMKMVVKIALLIGLICFFCPFVMVSCAGEEINVSGVELMTKISFNDDVEFDEDDAPNIFLIVAFVGGAVALAFAFLANPYNKKMLYSAVCSAIGALCLILFAVSLDTYYSQYSDLAHEIKWGWFVSLAAYAIAALIGAACQKAYISEAKAYMPEHYDDTDNDDNDDDTPNYSDGPSQFSDSQDT